VTDIWLALVSGLLGSTHCIGMCGGFAIAVAATRQRAALFHSGRVLGYAAFGALAGAVGRALNLSGAVLGLPRLPFFLFGALLVVFGLAIAGVLPRRWVEPGPGAVARLLAAPRAGGRPRSVLLFGAAIALLPCGLLYPVYALAASSGSPLRGAALLTAFGVGTVPLLASVSVALARLGVTTRVWLLRAAGMAMILYGVWLGWKGYAGGPGHRAPAAAHQQMR